MHSWLNICFKNRVFVRSLVIQGGKANLTAPQWGIFQMNGGLHQDTKESQSARSHPYKAMILGFDSGLFDVETKKSIQHNHKSSIPCSMRSSPHPPRSSSMQDIAGAVKVRCSGPSPRPAHLGEKMYPSICYAFHLQLRLSHLQSLLRSMLPC